MAHVGAVTPKRPAPHEGGGRGGVMVLGVGGASHRFLMRASLTTKDAGNIFKRMDAEAETESDRQAAA